MGTLRRECLRHFIFLSEDHMRKTVSEFVSCYNEGRPNQGIDGIPASGPGNGPMLLEVSTQGPRRLVARPVLDGLHHDYRFAA